MVSVFLSHSSKDKPFVRDLADFLGDGGEIEVWLDEREIGYGENIAGKIQEGLDADVVLLILSPDSVESKWVKEEWTDAYWEQVNEQHQKMAGVVCRECRIPRLLRNKKHFDLTTNRPEGFRAIKTWLLGLRPSPAPAVHLPARPPLFIGREAECAELRRRLTEPGSVVPVAGLAGNGKSTLALQFAHLYQRDFEAVHWLACESGSLAALASELARQLGLKLEGDLDTVVRELKEHFGRKRCLLIFDSVEDEAPGRLIPGGKASVLVTTRRDDLAFLRFHKPLDLPLFTEEQCLQLFREVIGEKEVAKHEADAKALFRRLEYLPIGVAVAAGLIRHDVRHTVHSMARDLPKDVFALLREAVAALPDGAHKLLAAMSVCAADSFRLGLAAEVAELEEAASLDALQELRSRSLVEELDRTGRRYRIHALVREAAFDASLRGRHAEAVRKEFEGWENQWRQCEEDLGEFQVALVWALESDAESPLRQPHRVAFLGYSLTRRIGRLAEANQICERLAQVAETRGERHALHAWMNNHALILKAWGRLDEAMALLKEEEGICGEIGDRAGLRNSYGNQALILQGWGQLEEAMALHKKEEAICEELGDRAESQTSYGNQALILLNWGRLEEAMGLLKRQEAICKEFRNRAGLQQSYGNQALILQEWGRLKEATALLKKQEAICEELGDRAGLQGSYANQALILRNWGRLEEAMALLKKQEAICEELRDRAGLQASYTNQSLILQAWGRPEEAMTLLKEQEAICVEMGNRAGLQNSYGNQALILQAWGHLEEAMALHKKEEAICEALGDRLGLQTSYGNQALILKSWGRLEEATSLLKKQEAICTELGNRAGLQGSYGNQALISLARGRVEEARALCQRQARICEELGDRAGLARSHRILALVAQKEGDLVEARQLATNALAVFTEMKMPRESEGVESFLKSLG